MEILRFLFFGFKVLNCPCLQNLYITWILHWKNSWPVFMSPWQLDEQTCLVTQTTQWQLDRGASQSRFFFQNEEIFVQWDSIIASHRHQKSSSVMADSSEFFEKFCFVRSPLLDNYYEKNSNGRKTTEWDGMVHLLKKNLDYKILITLDRNFTKSIIPNFHANIMVTLYF